MTIKSQPATDAYRAGWDRVFGGDVRVCQPMRKPLTAIMNRDGMSDQNKDESDATNPNRIEQVTA